MRFMQLSASLLSVVSKISLLLLILFIRNDGKIPVKPNIYCTLDYSSNDGFIIKFHTNQKFLGDITFQKPTKYITIRRKNNILKVQYNSIFNLIFRRFLYVDLDSHLCHIRCYLQSLKNFRIIIDNIYKIDGYIDVTCQKQNDQIRIISSNSCINFDPIGFNISPKDNLKGIVDLVNKTAKLTSDNLEMLIKNNDIKFNLYSNRIRGLCYINSDKNLELNCNVLHLELDKNTISEIRDFIKAIQRFKSIFSISRLAQNTKKIILNINIKHLIWNRQNIANTSTRICLDNKKDILAFSLMSQTSPGETLYVFLNKNNQLEIYSTKAQDILRCFTDIDIFTEGMLQGYIDITTGDWKAILINSDMKILTTKALVAMISSIRGGLTKSNTFIPTAKMHGNYDREKQYLQFDFSAGNDINILQSDGYIDFGQSNLDVKVTFLTKTLLMRLLKFIYRSKAEDTGIPNLEVRIHGDLKKPKFTKPMRNAIISQFMNLILF